MMMQKLNKYLMKNIEQLRMDTIKNDDIVIGAAKNLELFYKLNIVNNNTDSYNLLLVPDQKNKNLFIFIKFVNFKEQVNNGFMMIVIKNYSESEYNDIKQILSQNKNNLIMPG